MITRFHAKELLDLKLSLQPTVYWKYFMVENFRFFFHCLLIILENFIHKLYCT